MLNYKNSVHTTAHKTNRKDIGSLPTMGEFHTEHTIGSPLRQSSRNEQKQDVMRSIEGIINDVAKKATGNRGAIETVQHTNSEALDILRSPSRHKPTSMENLIDPEGDYADQYYSIPDVPLAVSVGPYDHRSGNQSSRQQGRFRSPSHGVNSSVYGSHSAHGNQGGFSSPSAYLSPNRTVKSPGHKISYDETDDGYGFGGANDRSAGKFGYGAENRFETGQFGRKTNRKYQQPVQGFASPGQRKGDYYDDGGQFNYSGLKSPNKLIPEQNLQQFNRDDLAVLSQDLRRKFNDEVQRNNILYSRCQQLEHENTTLRQSSVSGFAKENYVASPGFRTVSNSGNSPFDILSELERLKVENDRLRKETIFLLRKN